MLCRVFLLWWSCMSIPPLTSNLVMLMLRNTAQLSSQPRLASLLPSVLGCIVCVCVVFTPKRSKQAPHLLPFSVQLIAAHLYYVFIV